MSQLLIKHIIGWTLVLFILVGIAGVVMLRTEPGQEFAANIALSRVAESTGLKIQYEKLGGAWPRRVSVTGLVLSDKDGIWFKAKRITLFWHPTALFSNTIAVESAEVDDGVLYRQPVLKQTATSSKSAGGGRWPSARIGALRLRHFEVGKALAGTDLVFSLNSRATLHHDGNLSGAAGLNIETPAGLGTTLDTMLGEGALLQARITGNVHQKLTLNLRRAATRNGNLSLTGNASFERATRKLSASLNGQLTAKAASALRPDVTTSAPVGIAARVAGRFDDLAIAAELRTGKAIYGSKGLPPLIARADLRYTDKTLSGPLTLQINDPQTPKPGRLTARLTYAPARRLAVQSITFAYRGATAKGTVDLRLKPLTGHIDFDVNAPDLAVLPIPADVAGALAATGTIDITKETAKVSAKATSDHVVVDGIEAAGAALSAEGTLQSLKLQAKFGWLAERNAGNFRKLNIAGTFAVKGKEKTFTLAKLSTVYRGARLRQRRPAVLTMGPQGYGIKDLDLGWGGEGRIAGNASLAGKTLKADLKLTRVSPPQLAAMASGTIKIDTSKPQAGTIDLRLVSNEIGQTPVTTDITGTWDRKRLSLKGALEGTGEAKGVRIEPLTASLPLLWAPPSGGLVSIKGPVEGRLAYDGAIEKLLAIVPLDGERLTGPGKIDLAVTGTIQSPTVSGTVALKEASFEDTGAGLLFDHLNLDGRVEHKAAGYYLSFKFTAADGRSSTVSVRGEGTAKLGAHAPVVDATLTLDDARVVHSQTVTAITSGTLTLAGTFPNLGVRGTVHIQSLDANIPTSLPADIVEVKVVPVNAQGEPIKMLQPPPPEPGLPLKVVLDITVRAREQLFIRGRGLDSEWSSDVHIGGTLADPRVSGTVDLRRGSFDFGGHRFQLTSGKITFVPTRSSDPDLNIVAQYTATDNTEANMTVTGRASSPKIALTSSPSLPEADIMALILFGKPIREVSALQAAQVAQAVAQLTGEGPFKGPGILDRARSMLGLDLLNISLGGENGPGVTVGKYLARGVYVSASPGITGNSSSVGVTIDVTRHINVKTSVGQDSQNSVSVNWQHDY